MKKGPPLKRKPFKAKKAPLKPKTPLKPGKKPLNKKPLKNHGSKLKQNGQKKAVANQSRKRNIKRKQIRKQSTNSLSREIKLCDLAFSKWLRMSAADSNGEAKCYTCPNKSYWKFMQAGHFVGRGAYNTRWLRLNVAVQCQNCNQFLSGNLKVYAENLEKDHGEGVVTYLEKEGKKTNQLSVAKVRKLREHFELKVLELKSKLEK